MHGIHHSVIRHERDSNYSVIFSFWDRLFRTLKMNIPQENILIGIPSYSDSKELTIGVLLKLPFTKIRRSQNLPDNADLHFTRKNKKELL